MEEVLAPFLQQALNLGDEQIAELLYQVGEDGAKALKPHSDILTSLLAKDAERVQGLKKTVNTKEFFDNGYNKAKAEVLSGFEKQVKAEFAVDVDLTGVDLIKAILAEKTKSNLEEDKVKLHPTFLSREKQLLAEAEAIKQQYEERLGQIVEEQKHKETMSAVSVKVRDLLTGLNPALPEDQTVSNNLVNLFLQQFNGFKYEAQADGSFIVLDANGARVEDAHGNPTDLNKLVKEQAAKFFVFKKQDDAGNAGNRNRDDNAKPTFTGKLPASDDEFNTLYFKLRSQNPQEAAKLAAAWEGSKKGG
jgi:hypothetical protein